MREASIEKYLVSELEKLGCDVVKLNKRGRPDRLVVAPYSIAFFVEVKNEKGKLNPAQEIIINRYEGMGHAVFVPHCKKDVDEITEWLQCQILARSLFKGD